MEKSSHSNVPKFASFRVKGKAEQPSGGKERRDGEHDNPRRNATVDGALGLAQESATTRSKTSNKRSEPLYQKSSSRDPRRPHEPGSRQALKRKFPELSIDRRNTSDRLFQVDTKGDPHNLVYGTIHRYNIPSYYRWGAGVVVGLPARLRIDRAMAEEFVVITDRDQSQARRRDKYPFARNERRHLRKLRIRDGGALPANDEMGQEFISLRLSGRSKTSGDEDDGVEVTGTDGDRDYRSIEGRAKTKAPVDADMEYATDTSTSDYEAVDIDALESSKKARHLELMQNVDKEPSRASRWLELIRHQDALLGSTNSARGRRPTEAERRSTADIKLSMYEKALIKVKKAAERYDELLIGLMDEGSKIWDFKSQQRRWQSVLQDNPANIGLWTRYLDFHQTNFKTFTIDALRNVYIECLNILKAAMSQLNTQNDGLSELERIAIYVLLRFTLSMREAGYVELAVAVWQGLLEFNFFAPPNAFSETADPNSPLALFEAFWDSEVSRAGEVGAKGWGAYAPDDAPYTAPGVHVNAARAIGTLGTIAQSWLESEHQHSIAARAVARTTDDLLDEDPYRVVLYSDVKDFLLRFSSSGGREALVAALLAFCRLSPTSFPDLDRKTNDWWRDSFIRSELLEQHSDAFARWSEGNTGESEALRAPPGAFDFTFRNSIVTPDTLYAEKGIWFTSMESWATKYRNGEGPVDALWVRQVLKGLVMSRTGGPALAEIYLVFEWMNYKESARKTAKNVLKAYPSSLRLYNAYALIEWRLGNKSAAENVFSTALSMCSGLEPGERIDDLLLWRCWAWELLPDAPERALRKILSIPEGLVAGRGAASSADTSYSSLAAPPIELLKTKKFLQLDLESAVSSGSSSRVVHLVDLFGLFIYLSQGCDLESALVPYQKTAKTLNDRDAKKHLTTIELLHQAKARLLRHHATTSHHFRPALLRAELAASIALFPHNTIFLSLYAWNEARFRIDDRVRSIIRDVVLSGRDDTVVGWVFAIWNELRGALGAGHNVNSTKAVFERAVDSDSGRTSASIWYMYLHFSRAHLPIEHTISIHHRAIRSCPWVKKLYLFAFDHLSSASNGMRHQDLRLIYDVMKEKELRVFVDMD